MLDDLIGRHMATRWDTGWSSYGYDLENRLTQWQYKTPSTGEHTETYCYAVKDPDEETDEDSSEDTAYVPIGSLEWMRMNSQDWLIYEYDNLDRLTDRYIKYTGNNDWQIWDRYTYTEKTNQINRKKVWIRGEGSRVFHYTYDGNGNIITQMTELLNENEQHTGGSTVTYTYDSANQLLGAVHSSGRRESYSYDNAGNLLTFNNGTISHSYTYGDSDWGDLLTAVDGQPIQYDTIGNPTSYYDGYRYTFTWEQGRQLKSSTYNNWTTNYRYNEDGLRTEKYWADGSSVKYDIVDGKTVGEIRYGANGVLSLYMRYIFDESGSVTGIGIWTAGSGKWTDYYFVKNLQGDVVEVYGKDNTLAASYTYDAWGNILTKSGDLAELNPFRYRTYYFDNETWFYYLQSRYYDPAIGRFINADDAASTGQGVLGNNMFAYCRNNPVHRFDPSGNLDLDSLFEGVSLISIGITACVVAAAVVSGGACVPLLVVAGATFAAGGITVANGASEVIEGVTGNNIMRDTVYGGNTAYYEGQKVFFSSMAEAGTAVLSMKSGSTNLCFVAGTMILAEEGRKCIEEIEKGDLVWAWDEKTGDVALKEVVETYVNETDELVHVFVDGEEIIATPAHPFYSPVKGWTDAVHLRAGDILVLVNGEYVVVEKVQHEILENPVTVYNFQVEDYHTYYVSIGVLVHNSCNHGREWGHERRSHWRSQGKKYEFNANNQLSDNGLYQVTSENVKRMLDGKAPIGTDGKSVVLHHIEGIANNFYNYTEMLFSTHTSMFKELHGFLFK